MSAGFVFHFLFSVVSVTSVLRKTVNSMPILILQPASLPLSLQEILLVAF